jgi:hypothetical protein
MSVVSPQARVQKLLKDAEALTASGELQAASRALREASTLDDKSEEVRRAIEKLDLAANGSGDEFVALVKKWLETLDDHDGEEALEYLHKNSSLSANSAKEAMSVLMTYGGDADCADEITGLLLKIPAAKKVLASELLEKPTITFNKIFDRGDDSMDSQTDMLVNKAVWSSEEERIHVERDVFQLCLAQLMRAGQDFPERAMKCLSRLLGAESQHLNGLMDADTFDVILSNLDIRVPKILRSQATIACIKLLELSQDTAKQLMSQYIIRRIEKPNPDSLVQAFSAAAAVFPMAPEPASEMFLSAGFLTAFVKLVEKYKTQRVEQAALELLNAACMDKACREAIRKYCPDWLKSFTAAGKESDRRLSQVTIANLVMEKIKNTEVAGEQAKSTTPYNEEEERKAEIVRVGRFKELIVNSSSSSSSLVAPALEGLGYASITPGTKEALVKDGVFLKNLVELMKSSNEYVFGGLSILSNITMYRPVMSAEQTKLRELKAYANSTTPKPLNELDDDDRVAKRCVKIMDAGVVPLINSKFPTMTPTGKILALQILNSLSRDKTLRGKLVQQGALKTLLLAYENLSIDKNPSSQTASQAAAHAIARILISVNPSLAFTTSTSSPSIASAIRPLVSLLSSPPDLSDGTRDLLPTFEALMALTNLASLNAEESDAPAGAILKQAWQSIEDLVLHSNQRIQRAATELVCNLAASPAGAQHFAVDKYGVARLKVVLALADSDDVPTRRAAAGAVAMLSEWEAVVSLMLKVDGLGKKLWRAACDDEDAGVVVRGMTAVRNVAVVGGEKGKKIVKVNRWEEKLFKVVKDSDDQSVLEVGREVLGVLK